MSQADVVNSAEAGFYWTGHISLGGGSLTTDGDGWTRAINYDADFTEAERALVEQFVVGLPRVPLRVAVTASERSVTLDTCTVGVYLGGVLQSLESLPAKSLRISVSAPASAGDEKPVDLPRSDSTTNLKNLHASLEAANARIAVLELKNAGRPEYVAKTGDLQAGMDAQKQITHGVDATVSAGYVGLSEKAGTSALMQPLSIAEMKMGWTRETRKPAARHAVELQAYYGRPSCELTQKEIAFFIELVAREPALASPEAPNADEAPVVDHGMTHVLQVLDAQSKAGFVVSSWTTPELQEIFSRSLGSRREMTISFWRAVATAGK